VRPSQGYLYGGAMFRLFQWRAPAAVEKAASITGE
jgi:hypothetical protein